MRTRSLIYLGLICLGLTLSTPVLAQEDPYGRSVNRTLKHEQLVHEERDIKEEKSRVDDLSWEQKEKKALAVVVFEPGEAESLLVDVKVRRGGEAEVSMKGASFQLESQEDTEDWTIRTGSFTPPKKWKPLTVVITPPGMKGRKVFCQSTQEIASGDRVVYAVVPLLTNGDFYCAAPDHASAEEAAS